MSLTKKLKIKKIKTLETFDSGFFSGKIIFENNGITNHF